MNTVDHYLEFILLVLENLVDTPSELRVSANETEDGIFFVVRTKPGEEGQVIGKNGNLSNGLRTLLRAMCGRHKLKKIFLDVLESKTTPPDGTVLSVPDGT